MLENVDEDEAVDLSSSVQSLADFERMNSSSSVSSSTTTTSSTSSKLTKSVLSSGIICDEVFDENSYQPPEKDILEYALKIGIDPENEKHFLALAKEGLLRKLPEDWKPCWDESVQDYYYFNTSTGSSQWSHPLDEEYKKKVKALRSTANNNCDLSNEATEADASDIVNMELKPPAKLAPLPSLGGGAGGKKALPPLKKAAKEGHKKTLLGGVKAKTEAEKSPMKSKPQIVQPPLPEKQQQQQQQQQQVEPRQPQLRKHQPIAEQQQKKPTEVTEPKQQQQQQQQPIRGILKQISPEKKLDLKATKTASSSAEVPEEDLDGISDDDEESWRKRRAEEAANDKKRIHFDLKKEIQPKKASKIKFIPSESENSSSSSSLEQDEKVVNKPRPSLHAQKTLPLNEDDDDDEDILARHNLVFDPEDLIIDGDSLGDVLSGELTEDVVVNKEDPALKSPESFSPIKKDDEEENVLKSVKFSKSVLDEVQTKRQDVQSRNNNGSADNKRINVALHEIGKPISKGDLERKENEIKMKEEAELRQFADKMRSNVEKEKKKLEIALEKAMKIEIEHFKTRLEAEKRSAEAEMRDRLEREKRRLREAMEADLEAERAELVRTYNSELRAEAERISQDKRKRVKDAETEAEQVRAELREELSREMAEMREKHIRDSIREQQHQQQRDSKSGNDNNNSINIRIEDLEEERKVSLDEIRRVIREDFAGSIHDLEEEIKLLRSQIQSKEEEHDDIDELPSRKPQQQQQQQQSRLRLSGLQRSRSNLNLESEADSVYESVAIDLNRSLQTLQSRVISLEKTLQPFTLPLPMPAPVHHYPDQQLIAAAAVAAPQIPRITTENGSWTVEEQIYKSKMWLKQRNQSLLSKP